MENIFSVDFNPIDTSDILDIHKYLMKRTLRKIFIVLLTGLVKGINNTKCVSLNNRKGNIHPTLINLHPNNYSQEFHYYLFSVKLDICVWRCNIIIDLSNKVCIPNKTKDLNPNIFKMITGINESKTLTKHISCECKCKFDREKVEYQQMSMWVYKNSCFWERLCSENGKYLASIMDDSFMIYDEVIESYDEEIKSIPTNFNEKNITYKTQSFYILLAFLLITITITKTFITISQHEKLKQIYVDNINWKWVITLKI